MTKDTSRVGVFWCVLAPDGLRRVLTEGCTLSEAESYGDCDTFGGGHLEIWEGWRRHPPIRDVATLVTEYEYEDWPRGRIVFDRVANCFLLYADRKLQTPSIIRDIINRFCLQSRKVLVKSDLHYRSRMSIAAPSKSKEPLPAVQ